MGTGVLWLRYLYASYLEPFEVAVQLPTASYLLLIGSSSYIPSRVQEQGKYREG